MTITKDQADAARKLLKAYADQEWEAGEARRAAARETTQAIVDEMGFDLTAWAKQERERDLRAGNGRGMTEEAAIRHYVVMARDRLVQTLEAFGVDATDFFHLTMKDWSPA